MINARPAGARPRRALGLLAGGALLLGVAVSGCGGSGSDDNSNGGGGGRLTHAALVSQANAACKQASAEIARVPVASSIEDLAGYADNVAAIGRRLHDELARLTPPQGDRVGFDRYLAALQTANEQLAAMRTAASREDDRGVRTAVSRIAGAQVGLAAANAGFGLCASASPTPSS